MAAFDGAVKTRTRVAITGDSFSPGMGTLVGSGSTEDALIHGTLNQKVSGAITRAFLSTEDIKITGNQSETILASHKLTIVGNDTETVIAGRSTTVIGMLKETFIARQITSCIGPYNRTDVAPVTWLCPSCSQINSGDLYETKIFKGGAYALRNTNVAVDISLRGTNTQFGLHALNLTQFETKLSTADNRACLTHNNVGGLTNFLGALRNHANGTIAAIRIAEAKAGPEVSPPLEIGAPPFD